MSKRTKNLDEWNAWREVCYQLVKTGAINEVDMAAPVGRNQTAGERLLTAIRHWGKEAQLLVMQEKP